VYVFYYSGGIRDASGTRAQPCALPVVSSPSWRGCPRQLGEERVIADHAALALVGDQRRVWRGEERGEVDGHVVTAPGSRGGRRRGCGPGGRSWGGRGRGSSSAAGRPPSRPGRARPWGGFGRPARPR